MNLAARCWTVSITLMFLLVWGSVLRHHTIILSIWCCSHHTNYWKYLLNQLNTDAKAAPHILHIHGLCNNIRNRGYKRSNVQYGSHWCSQVFSILLCVLCVLRILVRSNNEKHVKADINRISILLFIWQSLRKMRGLNGNKKHLFVFRE